MNIGDKVKFDSYLNHNYMNGNPILRMPNSRNYKVERGERITKYKETILKEDSPLEGIFISVFKKKLVRSYKREEPKLPTFSGRSVLRDPFSLNDFDQPILETMNDVMLHRIRPSKNPRRIDDPRMLSDMAMIKYGRKLIGVTMTNIYKCNYGKLFNII